MRTFEMIRGEDETGVSGTGKVLEGVVFSNGICYVAWLPDRPAPSEGRYQNFASFLAVHVEPHGKNKTKIMFSDGETYEQTDGHEAKVRKPRKKRANKPVSVALEAGPISVGLQQNGEVLKDVPQLESKKEN